MGLNTTILILHDALPEIQDHPAEFVQSIVDAIDNNNKELAFGARLVTVHHADYVSVIAVGGNYGTVFGAMYNGNKGHHTQEDRRRILNEIVADEFLIHRCGQTPDALGATESLLTNLVKERNEMKESAEELFEACQAVVDNWSEGDLAGAANQCGSACESYLSYDWAAQPKDNDETDNNRTPSAGSDS